MQFYVLCFFILQNGRPFPSSAKNWTQLTTSRGRQVSWILPWDSNTFAMETLENLETCFVLSLVCFLFVKFGPAGSILSSPISPTAPSGVGSSLNKHININKVG